MTNDRPASWRMPNPKQMEKLAREAERRQPPAPDPAPSQPLPDALWDALLADPRAAGKPPLPVQQCRLSEIPRHVLRVECMRRLRIVEMQKLDAIRFYEPPRVCRNLTLSRPAQFCAVQNQGLEGYAQCADP
jgi:hypothetical protein